MSISLDFVSKSGRVVHSGYVVSESIKSKVIENGVYAEAVKNDSTVECVILKPSANFIYQSAFSHCQNLEIVEYSDSAKMLGNPTTTEKAALSLPEVKSDVIICENTFENCRKLHTVIFPCFTSVDNKIIIKKMAFSGCSSLRTIVMWDGQVEISPDAFWGCNKSNIVFVTKKLNVAIKEKFLKECEKFQVNSFGVKHIEAEEIV